MSDGLMRLGESPLSASFKAMRPCVKREMPRSYCNRIIANDSHYQKAKTHESQGIWDHASAISMAKQSVTNHDEDIYGSEDSATKNFAPHRCSHVTNYTHCSKCGVFGPEP